MSWRPLLRIARRDVLRARGRSALIVAMVMLPVAGVAFIAVMLRTTTVDGLERLDLVLGRAGDARVMSSGSGDPVLQAPDDQFTIPAQVMPGPHTAAATATTGKPAIDPTSLFPRGSRWITDDSISVMAETTDGLTRTHLREYPYTDPIAAGTVTQVSGRAPRNASEVVVSPSLLATLGLAVGDDLRLTQPEATFTIVGTYRGFGGGDRNQLIAFPGALIEDTRNSQEEGFTAPPTYLVDTPEPVTWAQVLSYNERGIGVYSRHVVENPPPDSAVPLYSSEHYYSRGSDTGLLIAVALIAGLAVLEVVLLAGAAFAVGTRRQSRALGLLAATGGTARHVRTVVLAQGLVLGLAGGVVGVALGIIGALTAIPVLNARFYADIPSADLRPIELSLLVVIGVTTGLLAALVPARTAARQDVVAALRGRRGVVHTRRRLPVIGLFAAAIGAALAMAGGAVALGANTGDSDISGTTATLSAVAILVGAVLTQLGLIVATPAIVGAVGRLGRLLPLTPRLALRDAARHRGRTAPAVAAILAAVAGSVALTLYVGSLSDHDRRNYQASLGYGQYAVTTYEFGDGVRESDVAAQVATISRIAPPDDTVRVSTLGGGACAAGEPCFFIQSGIPPENRCPTEGAAPPDGEPVRPDATSADDPRCQANEAEMFSSRFNGPVIGSYADFQRLTGLKSEAAKRVLADGGMVVFSPRQVKDGWGYLDLTDSSDVGAGATPKPRPIKVPAAYVDPRGERYIDSFVSPPVANKVGVEPQFAAIVLQYRQPPDDDTEERVRAALAKMGQGSSYFQVERGYRDRYGPGLLALLLGSTVITLGAAGVATGLAQADARADHATLAAVGAPPRVRRALAAWQAAAVAGLGAVLGLASGVVPAAAYVYADPEFNLVLPWRNLGFIALLIPSFAALAAWGLTRSRLPMERRLEV